MSKIVRKMFFIWQLEKEKAFLEDMGLKGYKLERVSFGKYVFEEIEPKKLIYQFDFRMLNKKQEAEYLSYFDEWEFVHRFGGWYYFFIDSENKEVDYSIFSDNKSRSDMYKRILLFLLVVGFPLYYQVIFIFPNMNTSESTFPKFYSFFRIVTLLFMILHMIVTFKLLVVYKKLKDSIVE